MADLVEKQIRDKLVTALTGLATTKKNVFPYRKYPVDDRLPALLIYTDDELITIDTMDTLGQDSRAKLHALDVRIEVHAKQSDTVEDTIAKIYKEVIIALEADPTLGGLIKDLMNTGNTKENVNDGDQPAIAGVMTWEAQYRTREGVPDATI